MRNIEDKVGYQIGMVAHLLHNQYNERLAKYDLTVAQARVLYLLQEYGTQTQLELQQRLFIKASTMNGIIESLLNKRLIDKRENEQDKRSKIVSLTENGRKVDKQLWGELEEVESELFKSLSKEEAALMFQWLKKIKNNLIETT